MTREEFNIKKTQTIKKLQSASKVNLDYYDINEQTTALIGYHYAILFQFGIGTTDITYMLFNKEQLLIEYPFDSFISSSLTSFDREGIVIEDGLYEHNLTDLLIIKNGLQNHWIKMLEGSMDWVAEYEKSPYYYPPRPTKLAEGTILKEIFNKQ